uniref:Uncharacterized protein n=1 Tax=Aegilops tauschii subsp. strangulata TaxID=200361 RepID=A0A453PQG1_AEGTS
MGVVGVGDPGAQPEDAHMARLLLHRRGRRARLRRRAALPPGLRRRPQHFPVHLPFHVPAAAMSPKSIQRVAAAAAATAGSPLQPPHTMASSASWPGAAPPCGYGDNASSFGYPEDQSARHSNADDDETMAHGDDGVDYDALADIDAFFQSPKCMDYATMMDPCSTFFAPAPMAPVEWEEEGEISLWSFSSYN